MLKHLRFIRTFTICTIAIASMCSTARADIIFSRDLNDLVATINAPISWTVTGAPGNIFVDLWTVRFENASNANAGFNFNLGGTSTITLDGVTSGNPSNAGSVGGSSVASIGTKDVFAQYRLPERILVGNGSKFTLNPGTIRFRGDGSHVGDLVSPFTGRVFLADGAGGQFGSSFGSAAAVPEPTSAALLGIAGISVLFRRRRSS
ncbi:MAG: hypothetical protein Aurels2KO_29660 [Aureliella sp.]